MVKIKIHIPHKTNLNIKILEKEFEIVNNSKDADFIIAQSTLTNNLTEEDYKKVIYIAVEPPLAEHRIFCYGKFDKFHTVITHNPNGGNQFPFTDSDEAQFYPCRGNPFEFKTREDTPIGNRGVFYAGMIGFYDSMPDSFGGINITPLRKLLGEYFKKEFPSSKIIGIGWDGQNNKVSNWRQDKQDQIEKSECDFILALENTMFPNYLYEKIWDGFTADRVTLYLGDTNIERHIPINCFIDLRKYFNTETKEFDLDGLGKRLRDMTQEEYNEILKNAREFRVKAKGRYSELQDKLTNFIVKRIKNG